jgi:hypothetical protein
MSDATNTNKVNTDNVNTDNVNTDNVNTEVKNEVKQDVQAYLRPHQAYLRPHQAYPRLRLDDVPPRQAYKLPNVSHLRPPNIIIENSRWNLDSNDNTMAGDMTALPLPLPLHIPMPVLKRSEQTIISKDNYTDSDIESEL